jgi:hypothetical protein
MVTLIFILKPILCRIDKPVLCRIDVILLIKHRGKIFNPIKTTRIGYFRDRESAIIFRTSDYFFWLSYLLAAVVDYHQAFLIILFQIDIITKSGRYRKINIG